jgi:hypothetical protein
MYPLTCLRVPPSVPAPQSEDHWARQGQPQETVTLHYFVSYFEPWSTKREACDAVSQMELLLCCCQVHTAYVCGSDSAPPPPRHSLPLVSSVLNGWMDREMGNRVTSWQALNCSRTCWTVVVIAFLTLPFRVAGIHRSNIGSKAGSHTWSVCFFSEIQANDRIMGAAQVAARPRSSASFTVHCPLNIIPSDTVWCVLTALWSWALLEKPPIVQLLKNFPIFRRTRRFINFPYAEADQSSERSTLSLSEIRFNIILLLTSRCFYWTLSFWLSHQALHAFIRLLPICATCPEHIIPPNLFVLIISGEEYKLWSSSL